jgi:hypothetical protein
MRGKLPLLTLACGVKLLHAQKVAVAIGHILRNLVKVKGDGDVRRRSVIGPDERQGIKGVLGAPARAMCRR